MSPRTSKLLALALLAGLFYGSFCLPFLLELTRTDEVHVEAEIDWPTVPPRPVLPPLQKTYNIRLRDDDASTPAPIVEFSQGSVSQPHFEKRIQFVLE